MRATSSRRAPTWGQLAARLLAAATALGLAARLYITRDEWSRVESDASSRVSGVFKPQFKFNNKQLDLIANSSEWEQSLESDELVPGMDKRVRFLREPRLALECPRSRANETLVILVNSAAWNWRRRQRMRDSWLSNARLLEQVCWRPANRIARIELLFSLADVPEENRENGGPLREDWSAKKEADARKSNPSRSASRNEQSLDLLKLDLNESYKSMSLKHLAALKFVIKRARRRRNDTCYPHSQTLVLKCDDDLELQLGQLLELRERHLALGRQLDFESNWMMCAAFEAGAPVLREPARKWRLSEREFPFARFPAYCSGLAYLAPIKLLERLLVVASQLAGRSERGEWRPLWVDDAFVTGILVSSLADPLERLALNGYFCYTRAQRLHRAASSSAIKCMGAELEDEPRANE